MKLGYNVSKDDKQIRVQRTTKETTIKVILNQIQEKTLQVQTPFQFLNHMIETLSWRAKLNIEVTTDSNIGLSHSLSEDTGITIGRAILELYTSKISEGVEGCGTAKGILDESIADVTISIEGRANFFINEPSIDKVEDITGYDLIAFLEGFCQGCNCTLHINYTGMDPHHMWESVFRAFGIAIRNALKKNRWQKNTISGLKGTID